MRLKRGIGSAPCVAWCARRSRVRSCMGCSAIIIACRGLGVSAVWWVVLFASCVNTSVSSFPSGFGGHSVAHRHIISVLVLLWQCAVA